MNSRRDYIWNGVIPADLVLLAGLLAYLAYAIGGNGPMRPVGYDDANRIAVDAWLQIPVHLGIAALLATGWPVLRVTAGLLLAYLCAWGLLLAFGVIVRLGDATDLGDVATALAILSCYGVALYFTFRSKSPA